MGAAYQSSNKQEAAKYLRKAVEYSSPQPPTVALQVNMNGRMIRSAGGIKEFITLSFFRDFPTVLPPKNCQKYMSSLYSSYRK